MEILRSKYAWISPLNMLLLVVNTWYIDCGRPLHGRKQSPCAWIDRFSVPLYLDMDSNTLVLIILSLFLTLPLTPFSWLFMRTTLSSLEATQQVLLIWKYIWASNLIPRTLVLFAIFLELKLFILLKEILYVNENMFLNFWDWSLGYLTYWYSYGLYY